MNIHIVTIAYGLAEDLKTLFGTATSARHTICWRLFLHSRFPDVLAACEYLARRNDVEYYPLGVNRGLARSWNQGILDGYAQGADVVILANDDMRPGEGDVDRLAEGAAAMRDKYVVCCDGFDARNKRDHDTGFGFTAVNPLALERIGCFDENYFPIYGEDADYRRRGKLAGLQIGVVGGTRVIHQGSKNIHTVPGLLEQNQVTYAATLEYQMRKWGGHYGKETYEHPFDNPGFGLRIDPAAREHPYGPAYDRTDQAIVRF
ncbi:MAG TPA: hypothetical protein VJN91_06585 [Gammaproteobacteria bacterium]|nr:hypothetical protein [Gammaproteobacteria bacterium]